MKRILLILVLATIGISVLSDLMVRRGEYGEWWYAVPGFFALMGLLGCMAIVVISKLLGHYWLQKREDYYGQDEADD